LLGRRQGKTRTTLIARQTSKKAGVGEEKRLEGHKDGENEKRRTKLKLEAVKRGKSIEDE
jgi:hypothetical protein